MQERQGEICCYRPSLGSSFFPGQSSGLALEATKASRDPPSVSPKGLAQEVTAAHAGAGAEQAHTAPGLRRGRARAGVGAAGGRVLQAASLLWLGRAVCAGSGPPTATELPAKRGQGSEELPFPGGRGLARPAVLARPAPGAQHFGLCQPQGLLGSGGPPVSPAGRGQRPHRPTLLAWAVPGTSRSRLLSSCRGAGGTQDPGPQPGRSRRQQGDERMLERGQPLPGDGPALPHVHVCTHTPRNTCAHTARAATHSHACAHACARPSR